MLYINTNYLQDTKKTSEEERFALHLKLSFFGSLDLLPQTRKALSRVLTTFSCNSSLGSKSSMQVISWLTRWCKTSLLPVDWVASLETLSERTRSTVLNSWLISSILVKKCEMLLSWEAESRSYNLQKQKISAKRSKNCCMKGIKWARHWRNRGLCRIKPVSEMRKVLAQGFGHSTVGLSD